MAEGDFRVLPNFATRIKSGQPLAVYGAGTQTRTYCYISDALTGFLLAPLRGRPGEMYKIGNPAPELSVVELIERIEGVLGRPVAKKLVTYPESDPADEPSRRCPDISKARAHLGYEPRVPLDEGLRRFLGWTDRAYAGSGAT